MPAPLQVQAWALEQGIDLDHAAEHAPDPRTPASLPAAPQTAQVIILPISPSYLPYTILNSGYTAAAIIAAAMSTFTIVIMSSRFTMPGHFLSSIIPFATALTKLPPAAASASPPVSFTASFLISPYIALTSATLNTILIIAVIIGMTDCFIEKNVFESISLSAKNIIPTA